MARLFDDAQSQYLAVAAAVISAAPCSFACWFNTDDITRFDSLMGVGDVDSANDYFWLLLNTAGDVRFAVRNGVSSDVIDTTPSTANVWHHACGVAIASNSRAVYLDGGAKNTGTDDITPANLDRTTIAADPTNAPAPYHSGSIAEVAIWDAALTDAEVAILAAGYSPLFVRPQSLVAYWPLIRDEDQDRVGGYDLTAFNAPTFATHPPQAKYPAPPHTVHISAGAPPAGQPIHLRATTVPAMRQWHPRIGP